MNSELVQQMQSQFDSLAQKLEDGTGKESVEFYKAKIKVADFYFERILPRTQGHAEAMVNPSRTMTSLPADHFSFDY